MLTLLRQPRCGFFSLPEGNPIAVCSPKTVAVLPFNAEAATRGSAPGVTVQVLELNQRYFGFLRVKSALHVHYTAAEEGGALEIVRFEERWNGVPLLWAAPFVASRRINGLLSFRATSAVLT